MVLLLAQREREADEEAERLKEPEDMSATKENNVFLIQQGWCT